MRNRLKRAAVLGLSACLVLSSAAGCSKKESFQPEAAAITVNGDEISAGLVKFATHYSQAMQEDIYKMYMGVSDPMSQDLYGNGSTMGDMIKAQTVATLENMVLAEQKMEEYGVSLTDEEKASITEAAEAFLAENDEEVLEKVSATQETVERYLTLNLIQVKMEPALSADVDTEVSDEEAAQRKIRYALFRAETEAETEEESEALTEDASEAVSEADTEAAATEAETAADTEAATEAETAAEAVTEAAAEAETAALTEETDTKTQSADETETAAATEGETAAETESEAETETETEDPAMVEAKAEAFAKAEEMIAKVKAGEDFEAAAEEIDADAPCSELTFGSDSTSIVEGLITATEGLEDGTLVETPIEIDSGYYVAQVISKIDRDATDAKKEDIVEERKSDRVSELYTQWREEAEITENADVLALIVFDFSLTQQTEASTEAETEAATEAVTEAETEEATEAATEAETEEATEAVTEAGTEAVTE